MGIFDKRIAFKPYEYPEILKFREAIKHSRWDVEEFNLESDAFEFKTKLNKQEQEVIKRTLLAISQIEISVKTFWSKLFDHIPKPEFNSVGITFAENEVVHSEAYSKLLETLGFNQEFELLLMNPVIGGRVDYLTKYLKNSGENVKQVYTLNLTLFSLFIENVSLFSQFAIVKSFTKKKNLLKEVDTIIDATLLEECYSKDTEVLTPIGWRLLSDMNIGDDVYQYNEDFTITPTKVIHITCRDFKGELIKFHKTQHSCVVTPNHEIVYYNFKNELKKNTAINYKPTNRNYIPCSGILKNEGVSSLSFEDRLKIAIQADGSKLFWKNVKNEKLERGVNNGYNYIISLKKEKKIKRLEWILNNLTIDYQKTIKSNKYTSYSLKLDNDINYKTFDWVDFKNKTANWCNEFCLELAEWDGYFFDNNFGYCSCKKELIDIAQTAGILAGYRTSINKSKDSLRKATYNDCYKLNFIKQDFKVRSHSLKKTFVDYNDKVYCVTVPSGIIITRNNNQTFIAGNCNHGLFGTYTINLIKKEYPEWFNEDFYDKIYRACKKSFDAEVKILDWIFGEGEIESVSKETIIEFIKSRFNDSLLSIGGKALFEINQEVLNDLYWLIEDIYAYTRNDFFHTQGTNYTKYTKSITANDLF